MELVTQSNLELLSQLKRVREKKNAGNSGHLVLPAMPNGSALTYLRPTKESLALVPL